MMPSPHHSPLQPARTRRASHRQRGSIMIVAVMILMVLTAVALLLASSMRVEVIASSNQGEAAAASAAAEGAVRYVMAVLERSPGRLPLEEDLEAEGVIVGNAAYWLIRPDLDGEGLLPGVADEAGKLSANQADLDTLLALPGMTQSMAEALIAWRTPEEAAANLAGAGSDHYLLQDPAYLAHHMPLESVEELLLVRDWSRNVLFGRDRNRDGIVDELTTDAPRTLSSDPLADRGLYDLLTVFSYEPEPDGAVNVNDQNPSALRDLLEEHLSADRLAELWTGVAARRPYASLLDFHVRSGLTAQELALVSDRLVTAAGVQRGKVNLNTASETVLAALPGLEAGDAAALVAARAGQDVEQPGLAWVAQVIDEQKAAAIGPWVTDRSYQFTVDVVAIGATGRAFKRYRVVVDVASVPARVVRWADWTELGWPLDPALRDALRTGTPLEEALAMHGRIER